MKKIIIILIVAMIAVVSPTNAEIPSSLEQVVIGKLTALEINWAL
jgi:hypothetical protein